MMAEFHEQLRDLLADRHTPEARALYELLLRYVHKRVASVASSCAPHLFATSELEEVVAEVLLQLMTGSLARFRGNSMAELFGFVRTVSDRSLWRAARKRQRERAALQADGQRVAQDWAATVPPPDQLIRIVPDSPLSQKDQDYLRNLLAAGTKVEYARRLGVSRAAVTQRVQRIQGRISRLTDDEQDAVDAWLKHAARMTLRR